MFSVVVMFVELLVTPLWPAYAEAIARRDVEWVRRTLWRSIGGAALASSLAVVPLLMFGQEHYPRLGRRADSANYATSVCLGHRNRRRSVRSGYRNIPLGRAIGRTADGVCLRASGSGCPRASLGGRPLWRGGSCCGGCGDLHQRQLGSTALDGAKDAATDRDPSERGVRVARVVHFFSHYELSAKGHGGNRRLAQLCEVFERDGLEVVHVRLTANKHWRTVVHNVLAGAHPRVHAPLRRFLSPGALFRAGVMARLPLTRVSPGDLCAFDSVLPLAAVLFPRVHRRGAHIGLFPQNLESLRREPWTRFLELKALCGSIASWRR